ncbi:MAG: hypothetical protein ACX936_10960 [Marinobacter sp.]
MRRFLHGFRVAVQDITSLLTENRDGVYQKILYRAFHGQAQL